MCLIAFAYRVDREYPIVVAANRDEAHARPASPLHAWDGQLAGRDLTAHGTWLSATEGGRFAAVTNVREQWEVPAELSRGELPLRVTRSADSLDGVVSGLAGSIDRYGPVNLLAGDLDELWWLSNRNGRGPATIAEGVHGLSNASLDTPWPKTVGAVGAMRELLALPEWRTGDVAMRGDRRVEADETVNGADVDISWAEPFMEIMGNQQLAAPWKLPRTGVPFAHEWLLSSRFVRMGSRYGTRCTTVMRMDRHGRVEMVERTFDAAARVRGTVAAEV